MEQEDTIEETPKNTTAKRLLAMSHIAFLIVGIAVLCVGFYFGTPYEWLAIFFDIGLFVHLCYHKVSKNHLGFLKFLGWRMNQVYTEGPFFSLPFCKLVQYSLEQRDDEPFTLEANTLDGKVKAKVTVRLRLFDPDKGEPLYADDGTACILLYDRRQADRIEEDVHARVGEIFDELMSFIPTSAMMGGYGKTIADLTEQIIKKGVNYKEGRTKVSNRFIKAVIEYLKGPYTKMLKRAGRTASEIDIPKDITISTTDLNRLGIIEILKRDYGLKVMLFSLTIEPDASIQEEINNLAKEDFKRTNKKRDSALVNKAVGEMKKKNPNLSEKAILDAIMTIQKHSTHEIKDINWSVTDIDPAIGTMLVKIMEAFKGKEK